MKVKCLIVDDEPLARKLISDHIAKIEDLELTGSCSNSIEAASFLRSEAIDLLFLDIQMPEVTGLQLIRTLRHPPQIIFTTAHRNYAPEAFDLDALDYLLKPISFERFLKAVHKYYERAVTSTSGFRNTQQRAADVLFIRSDRKTVKVPTGEIVFIESLDDYVKVHCRDKTWVTREKISAMEKGLPVDFLRIHRSYIVNTKFVTEFSGESVFLDKVELPFGRAYKKSAIVQLSPRTRTL